MTMQTVCTNWTSVNTSTYADYNPINNWIYRADTDFDIQELKKYDNISADAPVAWQYCFCYLQANLKIGQRRGARVELRRAEWCLAAQTSHL